jgi:hypothetical protein
MDKVDYYEVTCTKQWSFASFASITILRLLERDMESMNEYR